jgi:ABC-2 type transport system ATP-binding protein
VVLRDLSAEVAVGSVTGIVGPSGSGKTTLMRAVVGVQRRVQGVVQVLDRPAGDRALRASVAYMTQSPSVYADITVAANLRYFAAVSGAPDGDVDRVLDVVGLTGEAGRRVDRLSGGQRARVALASVLLNRPRLLVLDEPTVGLDPVLRAELWGTFRELAGEGATLLVSTHVMDEAARCDSVLLLRGGRLLTHESPTSLLDRTGARDLDEAFLRLVRAS